MPLFGDKTPDFTTFYISRLGRCAMRYYGYEPIATSKSGQTDQYSIDVRDKGIIITHLETCGVEYYTQEEGI